MRRAARVVDAIVAWLRRGGLPAKNIVIWDRFDYMLADAGFTAILPNMLWGGVAFYPSKVLPVAADVATRGDQIAECLAAAKKYGIEVHVWKVNWNTSHRAPAVPVTARHPRPVHRSEPAGRLVVHRAGDSPR